MSLIDLEPTIYNTNVLYIVTRISREWFNIF